MYKEIEHRSDRIIQGYKNGAKGVPYYGEDTLTKGLMKTRNTVPPLWGACRDDQSLYQGCRVVVNRKALGYIENVSLIPGGTFYLDLGYTASGKPRLTDMRVMGTEDRPRIVSNKVRRNMIRGTSGTYRLLTNMGVMTGKAAMREGLGGTLLLWVR